MNNKGTNCTKIETRPINLAAAVIQVMNEVKGIEKTLDVGAGSNTYKGVADKDVKQPISEAMVRAGLCILPVKVTPTYKIERWTEKTNYNGQPGERTRQQVFTTVETSYKLLHVSGESEILEGYGHGVDAQDKSAGKATTYALKYTLLYTFLVATGKIEDTDETPKGDNPLPITKQTLTDDQIDKAIKAIDEDKYSFAELENDYFLSEAQAEKVDKLKPKE